jgi:nucleotide-binding universal stress UspA family protein
MFSEVSMAAQALRFRQVVCPTDFSPYSADALSHAVAICRALDAELTVAHVHPRELPVAAEFSYLSPAPLDPEERSALAARLEAFAEPARARGVVTRTRLVEGVPSREIVELAQQLPADLLVTGFYPDARLKHFLLGSVTEELLRHAPCPVLTVRHGVGQAPDAGAPFRRILCGADLRETGPEVIRGALSLADALSAELTLVHVLEQVPEFEPGSAAQFSMVEVQAFRQAMAEDARDRLRAAVPELYRERLAVRDLVKAGSAHEQILRLASEEGAQLIVVGARGHSALERVLFGSTSRHVVRDARCPVLVVRGTTLAGDPLPARVGSRAAALV